MTIAQLDPLTVEAYLPVSLYPQIRPGMTATIKPNDPLTGPFEGKVTVVDRIFVAASGTFGIRVHLGNHDLGIPGGHRCRIFFQ